METNEREKQSDPDCVSYLLGWALPANTVASGQQPCDFTFRFTKIQWIWIFLSAGPTHSVELEGQQRVEGCTSHTFLWDRLKAVVCSRTSCYQRLINEALSILLIVSYNPGCMTCPVAVQLLYAQGERDMTSSETWLIVWALGCSNPVQSVNSVFFCTMNYLELFVPPTTVHMWVIPSTFFQVSYCQHIVFCLFTAEPVFWKLGSSFCPSSLCLTWLSTEWPEYGDILSHHVLTHLRPGLVKAFATQFYGAAALYYCFNPFVSCWLESCLNHLMVSVYRRVQAKIHCHVGLAWTEK